ncbi:hypothetical protein SOASR030_18440 [Leminorella grimontii]|uniref:Flagellar protein FliT n=1 Tax=Leminorella grimontii TaxID=82981 RepID=A0AAV5N1V7_9GAMM|nr:flagellar protein FliT [Leminorella grimontii]KFC93572.1 hypothetical protein GLGR_3135 [Leminorella grimontii ATCC 33999 = DSM 5078]GKX55732.1 hypothetical protein SOASR030_18440 [Leminorella grimontii]VFS55266.1 Uncharacterised protein [Leminorella grimontii]
MDSEALRREIYTLLDAMNEALDKQRWRRLPALHQRIMTLFNQYVQLVPPDAELVELKSRLREGFQGLIERRRLRAEVLQQRMEKLRNGKEGMLAYSMVNLFSEQS